MKNFIAEAKESLKTMVEMALVMTFLTTVFCTIIFIILGMIFGTNAWVMVSCTVAFVSITVVFSYLGIFEYLDKF